MEEHPRFLILFCFCLRFFVSHEDIMEIVRQKNQGAYISNLQNLLHDNDDSNQGFSRRSAIAIWASYYGFFF
jgi:hypothetical protein